MSDIEHIIRLKFDRLATKPRTTRTEILIGAIAEGVMDLLEGKK